jgi:shikimate dehydrogenase
MDRYAVIGNPIAHSKSPEIHAAFARQTGQDISYERILGPIGGFDGAVMQFLRGGGKGMNVTLPFKLAAFEIASSASERAIAARAANFLRFDGEEIHCDNTDGIGLVNDIEQSLGFVLTGTRVLLVGAGGAAQGVVLPLLHAGVAMLTISNRTEEKAHALVAMIAHAAPDAKQRLRASALSKLAGTRFDIVINATSSGLNNEAPVLPPGVYAPGSLAYDMVYGKGATPFLQHAMAQGAARCSGGLGMLVEQAAESFFLWRGVRPETKPVLQMLRQQLGEPG